jgi:hypothetical protein
LGSYFSELTTRQCKTILAEIEADFVQSYDDR